MTLSPPSRVEIRHGWLRWWQLVLGTTTWVGGALFVLSFGYVVIDWLTASQGPGEIPKIVGVFVLLPVTAIGSALVGVFVGAAVAPLRLDPTDPIRGQAFVASAALCAAILGFIAYALKDWWWT